MAIVNWNYHRKNCASCAKTAEFLADHGIPVETQVDARSTPLVEADALQLISDVNTLYVTRGTKVVYFDLKQDRPDDQVLLQMLIGRSGKLRAPTVKVGQTVIVGFDQSIYEQVFLQARLSLSP
jgi:arsenate reductase-like glutaredoxin family protein